MTSGLNKNNSTSKLPDNITLIPAAARLTEGSIAAVVAKANVGGVVFFTILSYPNFTPSGWASDETVLASAIAKYNFSLLKEDNEMPTLHIKNIKNDIKELENWLSKKNDL